MSKYETTVSHRREFVSGISLMFEITERRERDLVISSERVIADRDYYAYLEWRDRYARGLISDETLELILKCDDLHRFRKEGDFVRVCEGVDSATMDARINKTRAFEAEWYGAMMERMQNPATWHHKLSSIIGDMFQDYTTDSKGAA